jgi:hypothetical protein
MFTPFAFVKSEVSIVYDSDAQNFFTATGITNTGLRSAVNNLVLDLKFNSLWTELDVIYPFVADNLGALSTQFSYNLKNTGSFQGTFSNPLTNSNFNGFSSSAVGVSPPTINPNAIYMNVPYNPRTQRPLGPIHMSAYTTTNGNTGDVQDFGAFENGSSVTLIILGRNKSGINAEKIVWMGGGTLGSITNNPSNGYFIGSFDNSITPKSEMTRNGVSIITNNSALSTNVVNMTLTLGAVNVSGYGVARYVDKQFQFATLGNGLNNTEQGLLNGIVQSFQQAVDAAMGTSRYVA